MLGWLKRKKADPRQQLEAMFGKYELPTFPAAVMQALDKLRDPTADAKETAKILEADPGISTKLLALTNSASFGLRREVKTIDHAVALLGRSEVEAVLLPIAVKQAMPRERAGLDAGALWAEAAKRATAARALAGLFDPAHRGECFTAALLGDMAIPLIAAAHEERYGPLLRQCTAGSVELASLEREALGWDHAVAAGWLAEHWKFPETLVTAIGAHHDAPTPSTIPAAISLAGKIDGSEEALEHVVVAVRDQFRLPEGEIRTSLEQAAEDAVEVARLLVAA